MDEVLKIFYPDPKIFGKRADDYNLKNVEKFGTIFPYRLLNTEYKKGEGIFQTYEGLLYKKKGMVFPQAIMCINVAKRLLINSLQFATCNKKLFIPIIFYSFKKKIALINSWLTVYNQTAIQVIEPIAPDKEYFAEMTKELWNLIESFLLLIGIEEVNAKTFARIVSTIFQYDNAYYFRALDFFSEINRHSLLQSPASELCRALSINAARVENKTCQWKVSQLQWIVRAALLHPAIRAGVKRIVANTRWSSLCYSLSDLYYVLERGDFLFLGLPFEERVKIFNDLHVVLPPRFTIKK